MARTRPAHLRRATRQRARAGPYRSRSGLPSRAEAAIAARRDHRRRPLQGSRGAWAEAHVELFGRGAVVPVPPGIGMAPPVVRDGAYVVRARCSYSVRTTEATGVLELRDGHAISLGRLFDIWGQPLSSTRLAAFRMSTRHPVRAYLDGRRWRGNPRALPVAPHAVVVLEVGPRIPPHSDYRFPDQA